MSNQSQSEQFIQHLTGCQQSLFAYILSLWPDRDAAHEILQNTNLVLWRKAGEFRESENFIAWACGVARYEVLAHRRTLGRETLVFDDQLVTGLAVDAERRAAEPSVQAGALKDCLEQLTEHQREMIRDRYQPGGSVKAMSEQRGRGTNGISVLLSRIRQKLRQCVEQRVAKEGKS